MTDQPISQRARDAAADFWSSTVRDAAIPFEHLRNGSTDSDALIQAFAAFERTILAAGVAVEVGAWPSYDPKFADAFDTYVRERSSAIGAFNCTDRMPATFRWHEVWDRLGEAADLIELLAPRDGGEDEVERVATVVARELHGPDFDPFANPEAWDLAQKVARAALASITPHSDGQTFETIALWCDETFGPAAPSRIAQRANEEMTELLVEAGGDHWSDAASIEAADIMIILARVPRIWDFVERKMSINRKRKWRLTGDGCGYHIPPTDGAAK